MAKKVKKHDGRTRASSPGPAIPRSMGREGAGA